MSVLQIYLPEHFSPEAADCPWVLRDVSGKALNSGKSPMPAMPRADGVQVVVAAARVLLTSVKVPTRGRQKLAKLLPFAVEEKLMYDPESIHVAAGPAQADGYLPVAVIDRGWMEGVMHALRQSNLYPREMWPETLLAEGREQTWTVIWNGPGGFVATGKLSGLSLDGGSASMPPLALLLAVREARQAGHAPGRITLRLAHGSEAPDLEQWGSQLGVAVSLGPVWDWAGQAWQAQPGINLLQGDFAPAGFDTDWLPRLKPAMILAGLIVTLQIGGGVIDWAMLNYEKHRLQAEMESSFRQAFPEAKVVVDAPLQMRRNLADLRHAAGQPDTGDFLPLLGKAAPALAGMKIQSLQYERGTLKLEILLQGATAADLRDRLTAAGLAADLDDPAAKVGATVKLLLTEARG